MGASRESIRTRSTLLGLLVLFVIVGALTGCSTQGGTTSPASPAATNAQLPQDWPAAVPTYDKGTLFTAFRHPDGTAGALWEVPSRSASDVLADYGALLEKAGFKRYEWFSSGAETGFRYGGHGLVVTVGTLEVDGTTSLDVAVTRR